VKYVLAAAAMLVMALIQLLEGIAALFTMGATDREGPYA
jgi:hypothetical protein